MKEDLRDKNSVQIGFGCFILTVAFLVLVFLFVFTVKYAWSLA